MLYDLKSLGREVTYSEEKLVIENCSSLHFLTPTGGGGGSKIQKRHFRLWGFISGKESGGAYCSLFLCVFLHFREQPNISICLLTESGPCNIVVTGLSKAVCFQLKGI